MEKTKKELYYLAALEGREEDYLKSPKELFCFLSEYGASNNYSGNSISGSLHVIKNPRQEYSITYDRFKKLRKGTLEDIDEFTTVKPESEIKEELLVPEEQELAIIKHWGYPYLEKRYNQAVEVAMLSEEDRIILNNPRVLYNKILNAVIELEMPISEVVDKLFTFRTPTCFQEELYEKLRRKNRENPKYAIFNLSDFLTYYSVEKGKKIYSAYRALILFYKEKFEYSNPSGESYIKRLTSSPKAT